MNVNVFDRRGACPALSKPMQTGDGLLVRLNPISESLTAKQLIGLCESASRNGNGIVEITARGSFQIRGLTQASAAHLADDVDRLGIEVRTGVPIDISPLAGRDASEITDPRPLAEAIRNGIEHAGLSPLLGPKVSVVIDGGGAIGLDSLSADIRLTAARRRNGAFWRIALGGDAISAEPMGGSTASGAVAFTLDLLTQIATLGFGGRGRDLIDAQLSSLPSPTSQHWGDAKHPSVIALDGEHLALSIALPFGSAIAADVIELVIQAKQAGVVEFRLALGRRLLAICPDVEVAKTLARCAVTLGFIMDADDPRLAVSACSGAPACASGQFATREAADNIVKAASAVIDGDVSIHVSGCAKGCAHPAPATITLVGGENGVGLVVGGTARDLPLAYSKPKALAESVAGLLRLAAANRRDGEALTACLSRLDRTDLARAFERE